MSRRLLEWVVRWAPRSFRERHGPELLRVHEERMERAVGPWRRAFLMGRELFGAFVLVARLRLGASSPRGSRAGRRQARIPGAALGQDVRFALRTLRRNPGFTTAAVVVLALGIGATAAIFSAANAFYFRPLPFADPDRLVMLYETNPEFGWEHAQVAPANAMDWREGVDAFADLAFYQDFVGEATYLHEGEPLLLEVASVSGNFFEVLGAAPLLGRTFRWEETWQGRADVVVLSHGLWVSLFGADPGAIGRIMDFGTTTVEVVGVMPEEFRFPGDGVQLWSPVGWDPAALSTASFRRAHWLRAVARLAPEATSAEAEAQLQTVVRRLQEEHPEINRVMGAGFMPVRDFLVRDVRAPLSLLLGAVAVLLLLACTNAANLILVRAIERGREVAVRYAIGAGRRRVLTQMFAESLLLAGAGGILGLGFGWAAVRSLGATTSLGIDGATALTLDHRVVLFTLAATALVGVLCGAAPAVGMGRGDVQGPLREAGRGGGPGARSLALTRTLVAAEVALALLLVAGAGLMVRTFWSLRQVDPGFETHGVLAVQVTLPPARYAGRDEVLSFQDRMVEALEARAGIDRAGVVGRLPLDGPGWSSQFQAEGWPPERVALEIVHRRADRGYFEALDIPLVRGRLFGRGDGPDDPLVVVINETLARRHFPGEDPIGQRIAYDRSADSASTWYEIVGIVGDQAQVAPGRPPQPEAFENRRQDWANTTWVVMRTGPDPLAALPTVRAVLREMDPLIPLGEVRPLEEVWRTSMAREELLLTLLAAFGAVALLLAAVGVYAVTAQAMRRRTREIGIRVVLGARGADVVRLVLRQGLVAVGAGVAVGLGASLLAGRALRSFLYGVQPADPLTLAAVVALLGSVALAASCLPARRATRVDPVDSLRAE